MEKFDSAAFKKQGTGLNLMNYELREAKHHSACQVVCPQTFPNRVLSKWSKA